MLFLGFFLPTNSTFYLPVGPVLFSVRELAFMALPIINILCRPVGHTFKATGKLRVVILLFLLSVGITELILKTVVYDQSFLYGFKSLRVGFPLFSTLLLFYQGIKPDIYKVWRILLWAISISVVLSIISVFVWLPIYYNIESGEDVLRASNGRIFNANSSFGIIAIYLLFRNRTKWYSQGRLFKITMLLAIVSLIISFNRTYLALMAVEFLFLAWSDFSRGKFVRVMAIVAVSLSAVFVTYSTISEIRRQVDKRIISVISSDGSIYESTIRNNRDVIYEGIVHRVLEGYWVFGLPYDVGIFHKTPRGGKDLSFSSTDTSLINILLRYGMISFLLFISIIAALVRKKYGMTFLIVLFVLASLNIDSLMAHNTIFFIIITLIVFQSSYFRFGSKTISEYVCN